MNRLAEGKKVFDVEIAALQKTRDNLDATYLQILDLITNCSGKVIVTGMGKPGHIAAKLAATFASLGTPSFRLHPAEAMHGDLGMVSSNDVVIVISFSGESDEIIRILPNIKIIGAKIVGLTGNPNSTLAQLADVVQVLPKFKEACYLGLAPTSSTTVALCYGDSLAVVASGVYNFKDEDYAKFHPAGSLGKKLIARVDDLMKKDAENAVIHQKESLKNAIIEISKKGLGVVSIVDNEGRLLGIITDGDLRRKLEQEIDIYKLSVDEVMTKSPKVIESGKMAVEALSIMKKYSISCLPVLKNGILVGTIRIHEIVNFGIVG